MTQIGLESALSSGKLNGKWAAEYRGMTALAGKKASYYSQLRPVHATPVVPDSLWLATIST